MPKDESNRPSERQADDRPSSVRSIKEIKASLLRRAFDGQSKYTQQEMIQMIQDAIKRNTLPEAHRDLLNQIDPTEPRAVLGLNALAFYSGRSERYTAHSFVAAPLTLQ